MGSHGIKRRKVRRRPPDDGAVGRPWEMQNSPFTFEGQLEGLGRFARGVRHATPGVRVTAYIVVLIFVVPLVFGVGMSIRSWFLD